jgi:hypothetical protein
VDGATEDAVGASPASARPHQECPGATVRLPRSHVKDPGWTFASLDARTVLAQPLRYALAVNPPRQVPAALNGFALWNAILLVMMIVTYGYPIGQFFFLKSHSVPAIEVTSQESAPTGVR